MSVFDLLDKAIVGHASLQGFAVIGIAQTPIYEITGALGILSGAFSMIAAKCRGQEDTQGFEAAFAVTRNLSLGIGLTFFLASLAGGRFFFQTVYKVEAEALEELLCYFYPAAFTVCQNLLTFLYSAYYRNRFNTRISVYSTAVSLCVNLFFDASLVYGLFGLPRLGTAGAAWGSVIGLWAGLLVYQIPYALGKNKPAVSPSQAGRILQKLVALYPPLLGQEFLENTLFALIVTGVVARMGTQQMAIYGLLVTVGSLVELPIYAYATAAQTYALQTKASEHPELAERYIRLGRQFTAKVLFGLSLLCLIGHNQIFSLILSDQAVMNQAGRFLAWVLLIAWCKVGYQFRLGYLQGIGEERFIFLCAAFSTGAASIAVMILGGALGLLGVYFVSIGKYLALSVFFARKIKSPHTTH